ncbi:uncharacterized protein arhgap20b isoform X2 [Trichomycterus rosablanca]
MEDHVHLTVGSETQERVVLLFTDSLIIAKTKSLYPKIKARVSLGDVWVASCIQHVTSRKFSTKNSFVIGWPPTTNYVITLSSSEKKEKWLCALQWHSRRARQTVIPNGMTLNVQMFDSVVTAPVSADVHSTAENVVQSVIQRNALPGSVSDYQLCVEYDGEEETHPLIGYELPYCILLHSLRGQRSPHMLNSHWWYSADELRCNETPNSAAPRFVLRNKPAMTACTNAGSSLRHRKKKSLIAWSLRKGLVSQSEARLESDPASNRLFGQPLDAVCQDGNLPGPVTDLLCLLYRQAPETLGIFRRSANARSCRILKEKLNSGHRVWLRGECVFVAASLLTEFLRKLPGSVLGSDLYEDWMEVMETEDQQDRCTLAKSVLLKLPLLNRTLLGCVFAVLYRVHTHSDVNQMTAANLAVCIAPNMLWRTTPAEPEQESHNTLRVAALVRFLIENTPSVFGDELEDEMTALSNAAQQRDGQTADAAHAHSSSEETDQDAPPSPLSPDAATVCDNGRSCSFKVATTTTDGTGAFGQSRDRCLSEPSVRADSGSPSQAPPHPPVIRQSSYDNAVTGGKSGQSQASAKFSPPSSNRKGGAGKGRHAFWKSPQFPARFRHAAQRLSSTSRLASVSSLSSTATSSLSSLDSLELIPSPKLNEDATRPRPFLFGSAARLRPLTPEMPRKLWTMAFTYDETITQSERPSASSISSLGSISESLSVNQRGPETSDNNTSASTDDLVSIRHSISISQSEQRLSVYASDRISQSDHRISSQSSSYVLASMNQSAESNPASLDHMVSASSIANTQDELPANSCHKVSAIRLDRISEFISQSGSDEISISGASKSVSQSEQSISSGVNFSETLLHSDVSKKHKASRMKMTLFPAVGRIMPRFKGHGAAGARSGGVAQVNVPQTLFYNQNATLVLQSQGQPARIRSDVETTNVASACVSKATDGKASHGFTSEGFFMSDGETVSQSVCDVSLSACGTSKGASASMVSNGSIENTDDTKPVSQSPADVPQSDNEISINASASDDDSKLGRDSQTDHTISINVSASTSHNVSITDTETSDGESFCVSQAGHSVSISEVHKISHNVGARSSIRQTVRVRIPASVRDTVRTYINPAHTLAHTHSPAAARAPSSVQNRTAFSSNLQ